MNKNKKQTSKKVDLVGESIVQMSGTLTEFIQSGSSKAVEPSASGTNLKYNYIWQNLDQLFIQINDQAKINKLNREFLALTFKELEGNSST